MDITLRTNTVLAEVTIETGNAKITEDLATVSDGLWTVPESTIEQFITVANELSRFSGISDVDFVKNIFETFLNDAEREEFLALFL